MSGGLYGDRLTVVDTRIKGTGTVVTNLNADKLDGFHASVTPGATLIPVSGGGGLISDGWLSFMDSSGVANTFLATPDGSSGTPTMRAIVAADLGTGTANSTTFLRGDQTWAAPPGGSGASATTFETDLGSTAKFSGKFTITDAAIGPTSKVLCWQAPGPYTGKGTLADEAEMQPVQVIAVEPGTGSAVVKWQTPPMVVLAPELQDRRIRNTVGATFDRLANQRWPDTATPKRLGRVRGNVKFSYMVMA